MLRALISPSNFLPDFCKIIFLTNISLLSSAKKSAPNCQQVFVSLRNVREHFFLVFTSWCTHVNRTQHKRLIFSHGLMLYRGPASNMFSQMSARLCCWCSMNTWQRQAPCHWNLWDKRVLINTWQKRRDVTHVCSFNLFINKFRACIVATWENSASSEPRGC